MLSPNDGINHNKFTWAINVMKPTSYSAKPPCGAQERLLLGTGRLSAQAQTERPGSWQLRTMPHAQLNSDAQVMGGIILVVDGHWCL